MDASKATLPSPRALLTSLITTLTSTTTNPLPHQNQTQASINPPYDANPPTNPLKSLPASQRALLSTLHVLLPTGVLLQSLDLLDRGLVVRVKQLDADSGAKDGGTNEGEEQKVMPSQAHVHLPPQQRDLSSGKFPDQRGEAGRNSKREGANVVYQVRSSQAPKSRFKDSSTNRFMGDGPLIYTVRLRSWNCSCAAFAFESFPGNSISNDRKAWLDLSDEVRDGGREGFGGDEDGEWEFGGLSFDGKDDEGNGGGKVPVCKHLLACLLVEKWEVLDGYVQEREVDREEMAGLGGEG